MSSLLSSYEEGNRRYWQLPGALPTGVETVIEKFELRDELWEYYALYKIRDESMLCIILRSITSCASSFDVQCGIAADSKTIFESKAISPIETCPFIGMDLMKRSELDLIKLKNKSVYFFIEIKEESKGVTSNREEEGKEQQMKASKRKLEKDYEDLLLYGVHSDVTVEVKHKKFKCHKCILCVRSPVFSAMLEHDMKERASGVITIEDAEPTTFQDFLAYLYKGNSDGLNWKKVTDLYKLGDKYSVEDLKSLCVEQMKRDISIKNFSEYFLLSQQHNDSELTDISIQFFLKECKKIMESECWLILLSENPVESTVLIKALADDRRERPLSPVVIRMRSPLL